MDPRTLAEEAKARASDWRNNNVSGLCADVCALADALITALDDVEEQRGNAEGFWEYQERFREENERLREALAAADGALEDEGYGLQAEHFYRLRDAVLAETPEREG